MQIRHPSKRALVALVAALFLVAGPINALARAGTVLVSRQTVYVPVYSHIYSGDREHPFYLAATLSIRNTDLDHAITLTKVDYYDSAGNRLAGYLDEPSRLGPLASTRFVVKQSDKAGGSGANFMVNWQADTDVNPPVIEAVMIGTQGQQGISFTSRGQEVIEKK